ncbi:MAG: hypothetical protein ABI147_01080, partial [Acidobacteriaceae bacterium]
MSERLVRMWLRVVVVAVGLSAVAVAQEVAATPEVVLTKSQQKVLLNDIDATLKFVSADTRLAVKRPVKGVFISREAVAAVLRKKFDEDEGAKRLERSELVLKKFGLLDRGFHLRPFLLSLLTEQIAGYYEPKTQLMTLLNWVPEEEQLPVMAHELTHALQDQRLGLEKWTDQEVKGVSKDVVGDNRHIAVDEVETARQAVLEGQAMLAFGDYALKDSGKTMKDVPEMAERIEAGAGDMTGSPVMARAPLLLQQALVFPYVEGLGFEETILVREGTLRAFASTLDRPPSSSFEVLHPAAYLAHAPVPVMRMPDIHPLLEASGFVPYDIGVMGELDVRITTELFGGKPMAEALAPEWNGGIYYAAQKKAATVAEKDSTASLALMYSSRWKNVESAQGFFTVYEGELPRKYSGLKRRKNDEVDGTERVYSTNEGDVLLTLAGNRVFIGEGFDVALARKLRDAVDGAQGTGKVQE